MKRDSRIASRVPECEREAVHLDTGSWYLLVGSIRHLTPQHGECDILIDHSQPPLNLDERLHEYRAKALEQRGDHPLGSQKRPAALVPVEINRRELVAEIIPGEVPERVDHDGIGRRREEITWGGNELRGQAAVEGVVAEVGVPVALPREPDARDDLLPSETLGSMGSEVVDRVAAVDG